MPNPLQHTRDDFYATTEQRITASLPNILLGMHLKSHGWCHHRNGAVFSPLKSAGYGFKKISKVGDCGKYASIIFYGLLRKRFRQITDQS